MSKVSIVYIGPKAEKRDTIAGSRQVFRRHIPVDVDEAVAAVLLRFKTVWVEAEQLADIKKQQEAEEQAKAELAAEAEAEAKAAAIEADFTVTVAGEAYDLKKMSSPKIAALIEGADLDIEEKGAQESADDYKLRVRDAIRALNTQE